MKSKKINSKNNVNIIRKIKRINRKIWKNEAFKLVFFVNLITISILILSSFNEVFGATRNPMFIKKIKSGFERVQDYILIIATPAAGVSISTGLLMQKFSFGDEEKVRTAKRLIRGSIFAYCLILSTKFLLDLIQIILK